MEGLADRLRRVEDRLRAAERRAGRPERSVRLCAVSKTFSAEVVAEALAAGVVEVGENRVQEAEKKRPLAEAGGARATWHLIGHLQSNKSRRAVELFDVIQTVDGIELAERLDRVAGELGRRPQVFVQVDLAMEPTKSGAAEEDVARIVECLRSAEHLELAGLMTVPPFFEVPNDVRPYFVRLRELGEQFGLVDLSMGMSHDFEIAVEEGATIVRVGSAIFGDR